MVLKLKVRLGRHFAGRQLASKAAAFLTPAALCALILACWRLGADLGWTGEFAIPTGLFSHWQVWMVCAAALQLSASLLNGYATRGQPRQVRGRSPGNAPQALRRQDIAANPGSSVARMPAAGRPAGTIGGRPNPARRAPDTYPIKDRTYF